MHKLIAAIALTVFAGTASADELWRCDSGLVKLGDDIMSVIEDCGQPVREVALVNGLGNQVGKALYFDGGYGQADRKVIFSGGRVVGIVRLD